MATSCKALTLWSPHDRMKVSPLQGGGVSQKQKYFSNILTHSITTAELPKKFKTDPSILRGPSSQLKYWPKIQRKWPENCFGQNF